MNATTPDTKTLRGPLPEWTTAAQMSSRYVNLTPARVEAMVRHVGLHGSTAHSRTAGGVTEYSPCAVGLVEREVRSRGYARDVPGVTS